MRKTSTASALRQQLVQTFQDPGYRPPPLPAVALELMTLSRKDDATVDEVVRLLERDEMLAGALVRLVSSPVYAARGGFRSLRDAVVRLGVRTVRDVVFEAALRRGVFDVPEYRETAEQIGRHSTVTAYVARLVCRHARIDEENAFLCGLLHDIGFSALLFAVVNKKSLGRPALAEIWTELDATHEYASKVLTRLWGLPPEISAVVGHHHHLHTGPTTRVASVLNVAEHVAARLGASIVGPPAEDGTPLPADQITELEIGDSRAVLGIDDRLFELLIAEAEVMMTEVQMV